MIDLHSHVLPGLDDGPADIDDSIEFARAAEAQGTLVLAATPHLRSDYPGIRIEQIPDAAAQLNARLDRDSKIRIEPAGEADLLWALNATDEQLRYASFGQRGTDILVETPYGDLPDGFEDLLFQISVRGYRILLAHPERNPGFQRNPERLKELAKRGILLQITLPSVANKRRGSRSRELALALVREGYAHNLASDSHSASATFRPPALREGVKAVAAVSSAYAEWMVTEAPAAILEGQPLSKPPGVGSRRTAKRRFGLFRGD
jgi:protein-tyrosine phosphatase